MQDEREFERVKVFMMVSPYLKQGAGYSSFKSNWRFPWEVERRVQLPESREEREALMEKVRFNHQKILDKVKQDKHASSRT